MAGRPEEYKEDYIAKVDEYLATRQDEEKAIGKIKVRLPTVEGFARFLDVSKKSLYNWEKEYPAFLHALDKIRVEQQERLINAGLSGDYNSTIAKLILSSNHGMTERTASDTSLSFENDEAKEKADKLIKEYLGNGETDSK